MSMEAHTTGLISDHYTEILSAFVIMLAYLKPLIFTTRRIIPKRNLENFPVATIIQVCCTMLRISINY